ncbi:MAG: AMP-binding protein [Spirochaetia bacterium]|nr:AMP-binding protein [Spirochaetia bacterium]
MLVEKFINRTKFSSYEDFYENFRLNIPENFNFAYDIVDVLASETPDAKALVWVNDRGDYREFTFAQMKEYSDRTASFFKSLGIGKGDMVMLILQRRYEWWFSMLALHKLGAVCIPATHMLTREDIIFRNNAADIKMIVAADEEVIVQNIESSRSESPSLRHLVLVGGERSGWESFDRGIVNAAPFRGAEERCTKNDDISLIYFTSGTTSHPKMVAHDFLYPLGHIVTAFFWQQVEKGGLHLTVADTGWGKAVWGKLYGQWISESTIFVYDYHSKFKAIDLVKLIDKYKITTFCAPPTIYRYLIQEDLSSYDFSSLKHCSTAGEPLSEEVFNKWFKLTGRAIREGFGQTETTLSLLNFSTEHIKPGSVGKPAPYYRTVILDHDNHECEDGEIGEIAFPIADGHFPGLFKEYYRDPEKTASVMRDGYYFTGDTAWKDEDGYIWFTGRNDDVIKCSGYRIGTFEVESVLMQHPAVVECAVTGAPDPVRGQVVKATIVLAAAYRPGSPELVKDIQNFVKKTTAPYKYPRIVEFVDELPKTISGKIKRNDIRAGKIK